MKRKVSKTVVIAFASVCFVLALVPATAFSWGDATHVYISDRLKARAGYRNINEMWGSLGPDIFNFIFDEALCPIWLADQTHGRADDSFMKVWNAADTTAERALAYGFVSHNEAWGADYTAHVSGLTFGGSYGYINEKAMLLLGSPLDPTQPQDPASNPTFSEIFDGIGLNQEQQLIIAHVIAEYAIDIMLKNDVDPFLGQKVRFAARFRNPKFPELHVEAYAADYADNCPGIDLSAAAYIIASAESEYRNAMISYGQAISRAEQVAVRLIAGQIVALAPGFLGGHLPDLGIDPGDLVEMAIYDSMEICSDYLAEINATIDFVEGNLAAHGINY